MSRIEQRGTPDHPPGIAPPGNLRYNTFMSILVPALSGTGN